MHPHVGRQTCVSDTVPHLCLVPRARQHAAAALEHRTHVQMHPHVGRQTCVSGTVPHLCLVPRAKQQFLGSVEVKGGHVDIPVHPAPVLACGLNEAKGV